MYFCIYFTKANYAASVSHSAIGYDNIIILRSQMWIIDE